MLDAGASAASVELPRVLVVDDSTVIRQAIKKMLKADFNVVIAGDGEAGWQQLVSDGQIKCLITDIEMPVLDGYGFICRLRASEESRIRDLPIIAITGAEDEQTKVRAYACGATDFVTKPLDRVQLQARVSAYVKYDQTTHGLTEKSAVPEEESISDPVTQLRSRRYFLSRGEQDLAYAQRHGQDLSVIRLDIDDFKKIYKQYGDDAVDQILIHVAKTLSSTGRAEDTIARVGGAEFAILAPSTTRAQAVAVCERLRAAIGQEPIWFKDQAINLSLSMGIAAVGTDKRDSIGELVKLAEQRLSHAKGEGGNRVSVGVLGEALEPEELTLAAAPTGSALVDLPIDVPSLTEGGFDAMQLEGVQLEERPELTIDFELPHLDVIAAAPAATGGMPSALISIDKVLQVLARGEGEGLTPYLPAIMAEILPLLEYYGRELPDDLQACVTRLAEIIRR